MSPNPQPINGNTPPVDPNGPFYCTICGINQVNPETGVDTCGECLKVMNPSVP